MVVGTDVRGNRERHTDRSRVSEIRIRRRIEVGVVRSGNLRIVPRIREVHLLGELNCRIQTGNDDQFRRGKGFGAVALVDCVDGQEDVVSAVRAEVRHDVQIVDERRRIG